MRAMDRAVAPHRTPLHPPDPLSPLKTQYNPLKPLLGPPDFGLRDLRLSESYHPRLCEELLECALYDESPCKNGGACKEAGAAPAAGEATFACECAPPFSGPDCRVVCGGRLRRGPSVIVPLQSPLYGESL